MTFEQAMQLARVRSAAEGVTLHVNATVRTWAPHGIPEPRIVADGWSVSDWSESGGTVGWWTCGDWFPV